MNGRERERERGALPRPGASEARPGASVGAGATDRGSSLGADPPDRRSSLGADPPERGSPVGAGESHLTMGVYRLLRVLRTLPAERRLAAGAALGLFVSLFLPWYQETVIARGVTSLRSISASLTGWQAFSFVEAAVLLVAAATLVLLFVRAEGRAFHVPGGDGGVITAAGLWTCLLIVWRMFDKEGTTGHGQYATTSGIEWGIFVALGVGALLAYAGTQIRIAHDPEPPLPGERRASPARRGRVSGLVRRGRVKASRSPGPSPQTPPARRPRVAPDVRRDQPTSPTVVAPTPSRAPEMHLDDAWSQPPPARPLVEKSGAGASGQSPIQRSPEPRSPRSSDPRSPRPPRARRPRSILGADSADAPTRALERREITDLDISEPPTARITRARKPAGTDADPDADDQLTTRLDRPD